MIFGILIMLRASKRVFSSELKLRLEKKTVHYLLICCGLPFSAAFGIVVTNYTLLTLVREDSASYGLLEVLEKTRQLISFL